MSLPPSGAATRSALTSATADAYWVGAAVLLPIAIAALTLIRSRSAAAKDDTATARALQPGRHALGSVGADLATNINGIAPNTGTLTASTVSRTRDQDAAPFPTLAEPTINCWRTS